MSEVDRRKALAIKLDPERAEITRLRCKIFEREKSLEKMKLHVERSAKEIQEWKNRLMDLRIDRNIRKSRQATAFLDYGAGPHPRRKPTPLIVRNYLSIRELANAPGAGGREEAPGSSEDGGRT